MNLLSKFIKITLIFLALWLSPLSAAQKIDIESFRDKVIAAAKAEGAASSFTLDENDPYHITITHDGSSADIYLENIFNYFLAYPEEEGLDGTIETVTFLIHSFEKNKIEHTVSHENIVIVLRDDTYVEQLKNYSKDAADQMFIRPFAGNLNEFLMVDSPEALAALNRADVVDISDDEVRKIAMDNIRPFLSKLVIDDSLPNIRLYYVDGNTFLTPSMILLDEFWDALSADYPNGILFALPRKDQLFTVDAGLPNARQMLSTMVTITFEENVNLLSTQIFTYKEGKIDALPQ